MLETGNNIHQVFECFKDLDLLAMGGLGARPAVSSASADVRLAWPPLSHSRRPWIKSRMITWGMGNVSSERRTRRWPKPLCQMHMARC